MTDAGNDTVTRFMDQAAEAAEKLHHNLHTGYTTGFEYGLADAIYDGFNEAERKEILRYLIFDHLMSFPMAGGVLDECASESYDLLGKCADQITELALQQGSHNDIALRKRIADYICDQRSTRPALAEKD